MTWSYGDWHEDMVALYDDDTDQMVCWLQKKGGVDPKALGLIKAAPELLAACRLALDYFNETRNGREWRDNGGEEPMVLRDAINKAEGRGE